MTCSHTSATAASFRLAGSERQEPAQLRLVRHKQPHPATSITLKTGDAALPCGVFAPLVDPTAWLGSRAEFSGYVWLEETPRGWDGEITGQLTHLDLDRLVTGRFPHVVHGEADLRIERAKLLDG